MNLGAMGELRDPQRRAPTKSSPSAQVAIRGIDLTRSPPDTPIQQKQPFSIAYLR